MVHNSDMRTTVNLDDDVHEFATIYAEANGISLSAALNEIVRKAEASPARERAELRRGPNGLPLLPRSGRTITSAMVKELSEDELG
jgi:hypothetical protein